MARLQAVRCLDRAGVTFARDMNDLDFFRAAMNRGEDEKPGIAFVENYRIAVEYWNKVRAAGDPPSAPPDWVVLQAQPFGQEKTVAEIVAERPPQSYVAYVRDPSQRQVNLIDRCRSVRGTWFPERDSPSQRRRIHDSAGVYTRGRG